MLFRSNALVSLGGLPPSRQTADAIVAAWPSLKDRWLESAAVGAAASDPLLYLQAAFESKDPAFVVGYVPHLARLAAQQADGDRAARFVALVAGASAKADPLKQAALDSFAANLKSGVKPASGTALVAGLKTLLGSERTAGSALPLVARWDADNQLAASVKPAVERAEKQLTDASLGDGVRGQIAVNLIGVRAVDPSIVPAVSP